MKIWDNQHYYYYIITITLSFILFLFSALMLIKHVQYENKYYTILYYTMMTNMYYTIASKANIHIPTKMFLAFGENVANSPIGNFFRIFTVVCNKMFLKR